MELPITALFVGLFGLVFIWHSLRVIGARREAGVSLGNGHDTASTLTKNIRVHGNFAEYIPLTLIMMAVMEIHGMRAEVLYTFGALILIGRILHAQGIQAGSARRVWGMQLTLWPLCIGALMLVYIWFVETWLF